MSRIPSTFEIFMSEPILWLGIFIISIPLIFVVVSTVINAKVINHLDPENANFIAVWEANFSADKRRYKKEFRKKVNQLTAKYPAVRKFLYYKYNITKIDTAIVIDERYQKWICIYNEKMPVLSFSEIVGTEAIENDGQICVLIYTKNELVPEIRIDVSDSDSAERLMKTFSDMRTSVQNNLYKYVNDRL